MDNSIECSFEFTFHLVSHPSLHSNLPHITELTVTNRGDLVKLLNYNYRAFRRYRHHLKRRHTSIFSKNMSVEVE